MCHDCLKVVFAREIDEKVEHCLECEPHLQHMGDMGRKIEEPADQRIDNAKGCNEVQEEYTYSNENVVPGGYTYHGEYRCITAIVDA